MKKAIIIMESGDFRGKVGHRIGKMAINHEYGVPPQISPIVGFEGLMTQRNDHNHRAG